MLWEDIALERHDPICYQGKQSISMVTAANLRILFCEDKFKKKKTYFMQLLVHVAKKCAGKEWDILSQIPNSFLHNLNHMTEPHAYSNSLGVVRVKKKYSSTHLMTSILFALQSWRMLLQPLQAIQQWRSLRSHKVTNLLICRKKIRKVQINL